MIKSNKMIVDSKHSIGDIVYLSTDVEQRSRIVTGYNVRLTSITYLISCGVDESSHYDFEITKDKNILID